MYPVYHAHKSSNALKAKRLARVLAQPVAFTFLGIVLCALATNHLMAEQQAQADSLRLSAMMDVQPELLPPPLAVR